jgi:hypothetical protein
LHLGGRRRAGPPRPRERRPDDPRLGGMPFAPRAFARSRLAPPSERRRPVVASTRLQPKGSGSDASGSCEENGPLRRLEPTALRGSPLQAGDMLASRDCPLPCASGYPRTRIPGIRSCGVRGHKPWPCLPARLGLGSRGTSSLCVRPKGYDHRRGSESLGGRIHLRHPLPSGRQSGTPFRGYSQVTPRVTASGPYSYRPSNPDGSARARPLKITYCFAPRGIFPIVARPSRPHGPAIAPSKSILSVGPLLIRRGGPRVHALCCTKTQFEQSI